MPVIETLIRGDFPTASPGSHPSQPCLEAGPTVRRAGSAPARAGGAATNYESFFDQELDRLKREGNYRVFANLQRRAGDFPRATHIGDRERSKVTVWCSNDYLG